MTNDIEWWNNVKQNINWVDVFSLQPIYTMVKSINDMYRCRDSLE